jgi:hypothetical protein
MHIPFQRKPAPQSIRTAVAWRPVLTTFAFGLLFTPSAVRGIDLPLHGATKIHLANIDEASEVLARHDTFVAQLGPLERQLRLQADVPVTMEDYLAFVRQQAVAWSPEEINWLNQVVDQLRPRLQRLKQVWPPTITLVKTTGREEGNAPHCRGNAIILPASSLRQDASAFEHVLVHELFHILSRQSPQRRAELYNIVGYQLVTPIALPEELQNRRLTNPDAPLIDCVISVQHQQITLHLAPVLVTKQSSYGSTSGTSLFGELMFRLMAVQPDRSGWVPTVAAGKVTLWTADELPGYAARIGRNTGYIIHPEEILADNFVFLMLGREGLPDPWVVQRMADQLLQEATE